MACTFDVKKTIINGLESVASTLITDVVTKLSTKYEFDVSEALELLGEYKAKCSSAVEKKEKNEKQSKREQVVRPSIPLPWTGVVKKDWCYGVRPCHGLFSQCTNVPASGKGKGELYGKLCSTCLKQCETNSHGKPTGGLVTERNARDYKSPGGKSPLLYSAVLKKLSISREEAEVEALRFGLEIPECEFEVVEKKRGRPPSPKTERSEKGVAKKRGRPPKEKREVSVKTAEELLRELEAQGEAVAKKVKETSQVMPQVEEEAEKPAKMGPRTPPCSDDEEDDEEDEKPAKMGPRTPPCSDDEEEEDEKPAKMGPRTPPCSDEEEEEDEEDDDAEIDVVEVEINGVTYYMREDEAKQNGCEVMNESGEVVGRYDVKNPSASLKKKMKAAKKVSK